MGITTAEPLPECAACHRPTRRHTARDHLGMCRDCYHQARTALTTGRLRPLIVTEDQA